jgi:hypothetical protein
MTQLSDTPISAYDPFDCPSCGSSPPADSEPRRCECGYSYPKTYSIPGDFPWSFDDKIGTEFRRHRALRLLGKFVGEDPERLSEFSHVEYLALSRFPKFSLDMLAGFGALRVLDLDFQRMETLEGIERLPLRVLRMTELRRLENISALSGLPLIVLTVAICNRLEDYGPLGNLRQLLRCEIEARHVPSLGFLRRIGTLRRLALAVDRVDAAVVEDLSELSQLEWIGLRRRLLAPNGLVRLRQALPSCTIEVW